MSDRLKNRAATVPRVVDREASPCVPLPAELALAVECCRWTFAGGAFDTRSAELPIDWQQFIRLIRFHRVQGLVRSAARAGIEPPPDIAEAIAADATAIAAANLGAAAETRNLLASFAAADVPALSIKGLTLGALAYSNPAFKASVDIDLLVAENQIEQAAAVLVSCGYELHCPKGRQNRERIRAWHQVHKESTWLGPGAQVDLHSRLADNRRMIPSIGLDSPRQEVEIFDFVTIPTLADEELFAYLAVHGASSAWFRLKWITDFAAFVHRLGPEAIEPMYRRSQELGAGRAADQALLLANRLYGTLEHKPALADELKGSRGSNRLYRIAFAQLTGRAEPVEPTEQFLGTAAIHYSQFLLMPGASFPISEFVRQARSMFA